LFAAAIIIALFTTISTSVSAQLITQINVSGAIPHPFDRNSFGKWGGVFYNPTDQNVTVTYVEFRTNTSVQNFNAVTQGSGNSYPTSGWVRDDSKTFAYWSGSEVVPAGSATGFWVNIDGNKITNSYGVNITATAGGINYTATGYRSTNLSGNLELASLALSIDNTSQKYVVTANQSGVDVIDPSNITEYYIEIYDTESLNNITLRSVKNIDELQDVVFVDSAVQNYSNIVIEIISVDNLNITNATILLLKIGDVTTIVECNDYNSTNNSCTVWEQTDIPFIEYNDYREFAVNQFTEDEGIAKTNKLYVSSRSTHPNNNTVVINLSTSRDNIPNSVRFVMVSGNLYNIMNATSQLVSGRMIRTTDVVNFSSYWSDGSRINFAYATFKLYKDSSGQISLICQSGDDSTGGAKIPDDGAGVVYGSCSPDTNKFIATDDRLIYVINVWAQIIGTGGTAATRTATLRWDTTTANTWVNYEYIDINATINQSEYDVEQNVNASGHYFWSNGSATNYTAFVYATDGDEIITPNTSTIYVDETPPVVINKTIINITTDTLIQYPARINEPVKWVKKVVINREKEDNRSSLMNIAIQNSAENITITKISKDKTRFKENITGNISEITKKKVWEKTQKKTNEKNAGISTPDTPEPAIETIQTTDIPIEINNTIEEVEAEYYTQAPKAIEQNITKSKKQVIVSSNTHYTNVTSFADLPLEVSNKKFIILTWKINDNQNITELGLTEEEKGIIEHNGFLEKEIPFEVYDNNNNGLLDHIEWIAPHLSDQVFTIIIITKADLLDENRIFIKSIYDQVKEKDDYWSEAINDSQYVQVSFEQNLTRERDITIYARSYARSANSANLSPVSISVFRKDGQEEIARFTNVAGENWYKVYLDGSSGAGLKEDESYETFDLKIEGGQVEFNYIVDPTMGAVGGMAVHINTGTVPHYNFYNKTGFETQQNLPNIGTGGLVEWIVVRSSTTRNQTAVGILDNQGNILLNVYNVTANTWGSWLNVGNVGTTNDLYRGFDVETMALNGNFLAVYEKNTVADRTTYYRIWNGTAWSSESTITLNSDVTAQAQTHIFMRVKLRGSDNNILMGSIGVDDDLTAAVWNGTAWTNIATMTLTAANVDQERFSLAWEGTSGNGMAAWGEGTTKVYYSIYNVTSNTWTTPAQAVDRAAVVKQVTICGDPNSDYIAGIWGPDSASDILAQIWNGTAWIPVYPPEDTSTERMVSQNARCRWLTNSDVVLFAYINSNANGINYFTYNRTNNSWKCPSNGQTVTSLNNAPGSSGPCFTGNLMSGDIEALKMIADPNSNEVIFLGADAGEDLEAFVFNGTDIIQPTNELLETTLPIIGSTEPFDFDYFRMQLSQYISFSSPAVNDSDVFVGDYVNHSITISGSPTQYLFSWNASGASCDTWANSSWVTVSGSSVTGWNVSVIPAACKGKTIGWRFYGNNSNGINSSEVQSYFVYGYGNLNVNITSPTTNISRLQGTTFQVNATVTCTGGTGTTCRTVYANARYNGSSVNPDTLINTTTGGTPFHITGVVSNPQTSTTLNNGDSWNVSWTVNATGTNSYYVDVLFNSSLGNSSVLDNDTVDRRITISVAPVMNSSRIAPSPAYTNESLRGYCNATDANNDDVSYNWKWYLNDVQNTSGTTPSNYTQGLEINVANVTSGNLSVGQNWTLSCQANDSQYTSSWLNSSSLIISSFPPTVNINIIIDTTPPSIQFNTSTETSGSTIDRSNIVINVTANDTNLANITIYLYNSTGTLINTTNTTTSPNFVNYTGLTNGIYYFNATAYDTAGNSNNTETRNVTIYILSINTVTITPSTYANSSTNLQGNCSAIDIYSNRLSYQYAWYNSSVIVVNGIIFKERSLTSGYWHTCGIRANDSRVMCWGRNTWGQIGDGTTTSPRLTPVAINDSAAYNSLSAGWYHTCGIRANDSRVLCWGRNDWGNIGIGTSGGNILNPTPINNSSAYRMVFVAGDVTPGAYTCGIRINDSRVLCWGNNNYGQLGIGNTSQQSNPVLINSTAGYSWIGGTYLHTCAIRVNDSKAECWGFNACGNLGDNTTTNRYNPTQTKDNISYKTITAGDCHTCAIRSNDSMVMCWGRNTYGNLGTGDTIQSNTSRQINSTVGYTIISSGSNHVCGIRSNDSQTMCWGYNNLGQIGDGTSGSPANDRTSPKQINNITVFSVVSSGHSHSCTIRSNDSRILCWGNNDYGQTGKGSTSASEVNPLLVTDTNPYFDGFKPNISVKINTLSNTLTGNGDNWTFSCSAINDYSTSNWLNSTKTTIDGLNPNINFSQETETSGTVISRSNIVINVTANDTNLANITIYLYNSTGTLINTTNTTTSPNFVNYTGLTNGTYYFNATAYDLAGNVNWTETRNTTIELIYATIYGKTSGRTVIGKGSDELNYFGEGNVTNVFVTDIDNSIDFNNLQAIGRKNDSTLSANDFSEIDTILNMSNFEESITNLFSIDGTNPKQTTTFVIQGKAINNTSYINSTNSSTFKTGLLWDMTYDTSMNGEFDADDKEELVIVSNVANSTQGKYGVYDYEIRVPSLLRAQKGSQNIVVFYLDIRP